MVRSYDRTAVGGAGWSAFEDNLVIARCIRMSHRRLSEVRRRCLGPSREIIERARARRAGVVPVVAKVLEGVELTPRQEQTLRFLLRGKSEKQVAAALGLSRNTVHLYVTGIYRRLGVHSRTELLMKCLGRPRGGAVNGAAVGGAAGESLREIHLRINTNGHE